MFGDGSSSRTGQFRALGMSVSKGWLISFLGFLNQRDG